MTFSVVKHFGGYDVHQIFNGRQIVDFDPKSKQKSIFKVKNTRVPVRLKLGKYKQKL